MSKKIKKLDLADSTMLRIKEQNIRMLPKSYFVLRKFLLAFIVVIIFGLMFLSSISIIYAIKYDTFSDYLDFDNGVILYLKSLPWAGIMVAFLSVIALALLSKKIRISLPKFQLNQAFASVLIFVLIVGFFGNIASTTKTPELLSFLNNLSTEDPIKLIANVEEKQSEYLVVKSAQNTYKIRIDQKSGELNVGDEILVLGRLRGDVVEPEALKVLYKAPEIEQKAEKTKPKNVKKSPEVSQETQAEPTIEPVQSTVEQTLNENIKPEVTPKPKPQTTVEKDKISITETLKLSDSKYKVSWSSNFELENGFKLVWSKSPNPVYPGDEYYFDPNPATSGLGKVHNSLGSGTYYVRVCQYLGGSCGVYSNQVTIVFP